MFSIIAWIADGSNYLCWYVLIYEQGKIEGHINLTCLELPPGRSINVYTIGWETTAERIVHIGSGPTK